MSVDSFNRPLINQEEADALTQWVKMKASEASADGQQKLIDLLKDQQSDSQGAQFLDLGLPISAATVQKAYNSEGGQYLVGRIKDVYNEFQNNGGDFEGAVNKVWGNVKSDAVGKIGDFKGQAQEAVQSKLQSLKDEAMGKVNDLRSQAEQKVQSLRDDVQGRVNDLQQKAMDLKAQAEGQVDSVKNDLQSRAQQLQQQANDMKSQAESQVESLRNDAEQQVRSIQDEATSKIQSAQSEIGNQVSSIEGEANSGLARGASSLENLQGNVEKNISDLSETGQSLFGNFKASFTNLKNSARNVFDNEYGKVANIGDNIGYNGARGSIANAARGLMAKVKPPSVDTEFGTNDLMQETNVNSIYSSLTKNVVRQAEPDVPPPEQEGTELQPMSSTVGKDSFAAYEKPETQSITDGQVGIDAEKIGQATDDVGNVIGDGVGEGVAKTAASDVAGDVAADVGVEAAATGLEVAGAAADSTGIGAPIGIALGLIGGIVSAFEGLKDLFDHHHDDTPAPPPIIAQPTVQLGTSQ